MPTGCNDVDSLVPNVIPEKEKVSPNKEKTKPNQPNTPPKQINPQPTTKSYPPL